MDTGENVTVLPSSNPSPDNPTVTALTVELKIAFQAIAEGVWLRMGACTATFIDEHVINIVLALITMVLIVKPPAKASDEESTPPAERKGKLDIVT